MKKDKLLFILYTLCAVLTTAKTVMDIISKSYNDSVILFALNILCAVIWTVLAVLQFNTYRKSKDKAE